MSTYKYCFIHTPDFNLPKTIYYFNLKKSVLK